MKIVVFGSTGGTGIELMKQAIKRGHEVTAFARDPSQIAISDPNVQLVQGDVLDLKTVQAAVTGAQAAISALGVKLGQSPGTVRSEGTSNIVKALCAANVRRFISVSTVGMGDSFNRLSFFARMLLPRIIGSERLEEAERQEQIIRQSNLDWTMLRPTRLVNSPARGRYQIGGDLHTGMGSQLSRADLASALFDQLETAEFMRQTPTITN
jgi:putative NADH-flavin reductase